MTDDTKLSADKVAAFLRQNPEFFQQRSDLLELMRLPDPRGPAVSLLERQAAILRERNQELRERLNGLIDVARENDQLFEHTRRLTLALLEARRVESRRCRLRPPRPWRCSRATRARTSCTVTWVQGGRWGAARSRSRR